MTGQIPMLQSSETRTLGSKYKREKQERRRGELLDAAAEVFADKGYHAATTADITERLGLRASGLYYYFTSKEHALEEVCLRVFREFEARLWQLLNRKLDPIERIREAMRLHLDPDWRPYSITFIHNRRFLPDETGSDVRVATTAYIDRWRLMFEAAVVDGALPPDFNSEAGARTALAMCNGATPALAGQGTRDLRRFAESMIEIFLKGVLPRRAAG